MKTVTRKRLGWIVGAAVLAIVLVVSGLFIYARYLAPRPVDALALPETGQAQDAGKPLGELDGSWRVADGSEAGYRVDEILSGQPVTVVGRTSEVSGAAVVEGKRLAEATFEVKLDGVATDNPNRDQYFRGTVIDVGRYPEAVFKLTRPADLSELEESASVKVPLAGELTVRDATRPVTFDATVQADGSRVRVQGRIPMNYADYGVTPPDLGFVKVDPKGLVEFLVTLER